MPMIPVNVDSSTVAATSIVTSVITFFFATAVVQIKPTIALFLAAIVGLILYSTGVIPIGLLLVVGIAMIAAILNATTSAVTPSEPSSEKDRRRTLGYVDNPQLPNAYSSQLNQDADSSNQSLAINRLEQLAESGDAEAQNNLGIQYDIGQGVPQNHEKAAQWFRKAADQGHADAQCNLGLLYSDGKGVPLDNTEAWKWLHLAYSGGTLEAKKNLELIEQMLSPDQIDEGNRRASLVMEMKDNATENETWTQAVLFFIHQPMVALKVGRYPVAKIIDQFPVDERGRIKESIDAVKELGFFVIDESDIQLTDKGETLFELLPSLCQLSADKRLELEKTHPRAASLLTAIACDSRLSPPLGWSR